MDRYLHIVTNDVPWPADFGGVVDLLYKIKALHANGIKIHLHCFVHQRPQQEALNQYCASVTYYARQKKISRISFRLPFIVSSRKSAALLRNLQKDNYPVLLEGIHCTHLLYAGKLSSRKVVLRLHNVEFEYYHQLSVHEKNPFRKLYFHLESLLLKKYENAIAKKVAIIAVSDHDVTLYRELFGAKNISHLPVFLPYENAIGKMGNGCYCLYHANLSINENEEAAIWLLQQVFNDTDVPFIIAGKNPSQKLEFLAQSHSNVCIVANPADKDLQDMISKAQINVLPSFNNTGVKLKLLNGLFNGRHCLVNRAGVDGSGLKNLCTIAEDADDFKTAINYLYEMPYTKEENEKRQLMLQLYNNQQNTEKLVAIIWPDKTTTG